jgi:hypothetical protein
VNPSVASNVPLGHAKDSVLCFIAGQKSSVSKQKHKEVLLYFFSVPLFQRGTWLRCFLVAAKTVSTTLVDLLVLCAFYHDPQINIELKSAQGFKTKIECAAVFFRQRIAEESGKNKWGEVAQQSINFKSLLDCFW